MSRGPRTESQAETDQEADERRWAEDDRKTRQRNRLLEPMRSAMLRARKRRAFDPNRELATIIRYEKEAATILALLREEMMAAGGTLKLVATAPGCKPFDILTVNDIDFEGVPTSPNSVAHGLMMMWRYEMRGRHKRFKPDPDPSSE